MYARLTPLQSTPEQLPELKQQLQDRVLPALRLQEGFKQLLVLCDTEGKLVTLSLWGTEADEQTTFEREYLHDVLNESMLMLLKNSRSESFEVLVTSESR